MSLMHLYLPVGLAASTPLTIAGAVIAEVRIVLFKFDVLLIRLGICSYGTPMSVVYQWVCLPVTTIVPFTDDVASTGVFSIAAFAG